jgi:hypothetical protein
MLGLQALPDFDRQALLGEDIDDRQYAKPRALHELIGHEIHAPGLIGSRRLRACLALHCRDMAPGALAPQRQSLLALEQHMHAPVAIAHTLVRDLPNPRTELYARVRQLWYLF